MMDELVQRILTNPLAEEVLSTIVITEEEEALFIQQHEVVTNVLKARRHLKKTKDEEKRKRWCDMFLRNLVIFHDIEIKMHQLGTLRQSIIQMAATSRNAPYVVKQETLLHIANLRKKFARSVMEKEDEMLVDAVMNSVLSSPSVSDEIRNKVLGFVQGSLESEDLENYVFKKLTEEVEDFEERFGKK